MKSTPLLRQLFAVALITTFIALACRKNDWHLQAGNQDKQNEALFFNAYSPNSPAAQAVFDFTRNQNAQYHFAAHYLEQIGKPRWDKALVFESRNATGAATADSTIVYIPFVREAQHYVNASLIVNMKPGDTTFRMLCDWQYKSFGFAERRSASSWNANSMMRMYMLMDKAVFGTENFKIKDVRLLPASLLQQLKAKQIPLDSISVKASLQKPRNEGLAAEATIYQDCYSIFLCINRVKVQAEQPDLGVVTQTFTSGCMMSYSDHGCVTYWDDEESDEGGLWSGTGGIYYGGGGGGGGTGSGWSGGSDGYWPDPTNPNPIDCMDYASYPVGQDYPCSRGWGPDVLEIQNNINDPCLKKMVDNIINKNLNNKITNFVNSVFANSDRFDLHFFDGTLIGQQSQIDAYTKTDISSPGVLRSVIKLNTLQLQKASEEYIAATIIHELIHAWIDHNYPVSQPNNREQHELMANTYRFNLMKDILRSMYTNITEQEASDLTWGGLYSTIKFNNLSISDRERIGATNSLFKNGDKGIVCTP